MNIIDMSTEGLSPEEIVEFRKILNQHIKNARKKSQHKKCLLCGKESSFCNSHTIPQLIMQEHFILFVDHVITAYLKIMKRKKHIQFVRQRLRLIKLH